MKGIRDCVSILTTRSSMRILIGNCRHTIVRQRRRWRSPWWWWWWWYRGEFGVYPLGCL